MVEAVASEEAACGGGRRGEAGSGSCGFAGSGFDGYGPVVGSDDPVAGADELNFVPQSEEPQRAPL